MSGIPPLAIIPWNHLKEGEFLGRGAFGIVHSGEWQGRQVAIKKLVLETLSPKLIKDFQREAEILWQYGESPHIIKLLGICKEQTHFSLIMEYMPKGSLFDILSDEELELTWVPLRFSIALDIALGLSYLHKEGIVHRDLKSPNVLLDDNYKAKISDFGLAKVRFATESKSQIQSSKEIVGTIQWLAPEVLTVNPVYSTASDVYSYAIILWEIASRKIPYAGARINIEENVKKGERPEIPENTPTGLQTLIQLAWHQDPLERPGIHYLTRQLEKWLPTSSIAQGSSPSIPEKKEASGPLIPPSHEKMFAALEQKKMEDLVQLLVMENSSLQKHREFLTEGFSSEWRGVHLAVILGRLDIVQSLCEKTPGLLVITGNTLASSLFHLALFFGAPLKIIQWLVQQDHSFLEKSILLKNKEEAPPLHLAAMGGNLEVVQWLVQQNRSWLQKTNSSEETPLFAAAEAGNLEVVQWLVKQDRTLLKKSNTSGDTPLHAASRNGFLEVVKWFIAQDKALLQITNLFHQTPLHTAQSLEIIQSILQQDRSLLYEQNPDNGETLLHVAATAYPLKVIEWLVGQDRSLLHKPNKAGETPGHLATSSLCIEKEEKKERLKIIQWFVKEDPSLLQKSRTDGETLLHAAVSSGDLDRVFWIIEQNRSLLNKSRIDGETPLHTAARGGSLFGRFLEIAQLLVQEDRSLLKQTKNNGETPLHVLASGMFHKEKRFVLAQWLVQEDRTLLQKTTVDGETPLHSCARSLFIKLAKWLVEQDRSLLTKKSKRGQTASDLAKSLIGSEEAKAEWQKTVV